MHQGSHVEVLGIENRLTKAANVLPSVPDDMSHDSLGLRLHLCLCMRAARVMTV
jgi:hypothetical protein